MSLMSVRTSSMFSVGFECEAVGEPLDDTVNVEVVGEMPQGAIMSIEMF